uniref:uncharacterized protein n=1 Tax=Pristiophorus japonicus TaxID=55135 RepID=UPI00398EF8D6
MAQKIKREASPLETYKLQVQHEFHCTQITSYNHKLHLQHEENESRTNTQLEINYGKHWDEINNRKKIFITQLFKNDSSLSLTNYFMEFTLQIPEKQINYRTQLQHSHLLQGYAESNTHAKVLYNDKIPFQAGIQWKDTSKPNLKKWEGSPSFWMVPEAQRLHAAEQSWEHPASSSKESPLLTLSPPSPLVHL